MSTQEQDKQNHVNAVMLTPQSPDNPSVEWIINRLGFLNRRGQRRVRAAIANACRYGRMERAESLREMLKRMSPPHNIRRLLENAINSTDNTLGGRNIRATKGLETLQ